LKYQRGNQNPYIEEEKKTQRSKDKVQQKKQRSTKDTYKTKVLVTWTPLKTGGENVIKIYTRNIATTCRHVSVHI
jgi:hypothetical protein